MATAKTAKKTTAAVTAKPAPAAPAPKTAAPAPAPSPAVLTIVVVDSKSQPVSGASITINPGSVTGTTNASGEFQFQLGNYPKYDITATYGSEAATVPYYVTRDGATRLIINPVYVTAVQQQRSAWPLAGVAKGAGIAIAIAVVIAVGWKLIFGHPKE